MHNAYSITRAMERYLGRFVLGQVSNVPTYTCDGEFDYLMVVVITWVCRFRRLKNGWVDFF